jgi:hypothetical protein
LGRLWVIAVVVTLDWGHVGNPQVVQVLREQDGMSPVADHAIAIGSGSISSFVENFASDSALK